MTRSPRTTEPAPATSRVRAVRTAEPASHALQEAAALAGEQLSDQRRRDAHERRTGPRAYTAEQAAFIDRVVAARKPLPTPPLPVE